MFIQTGVGARPKDLSQKWRAVCLLFLSTRYLWPKNAAILRLLLGAALKPLSKDRSVIARFWDKMTGGDSAWGLTEISATPHLGPIHECFTSLQHLSEPPFLCGSALRAQAQSPVWGATGWLGPVCGVYPVIHCAGASDLAADGYRA